MSKKRKSFAEVREKALDSTAAILRPVVASMLAYCHRMKRSQKAQATPKKKTLGAGKFAQGGSDSGRRPFMLHFPMQSQILFTKRLGMILRSGMPIMEGLHLLKDEKQSSSATYIYESLINDVAHGQPLSGGMQKFEKHFGEFTVNIIRVGEASGTLHENLEYVAEELKRKQTLKKKVVGALVYPAVIVVATIGIVVMLTVYIFPKIIPIFTSVKATLPLSTRILIVVSDYLSHWGIHTLAAFIALVVGLVFATRWSRFHYWIDRILLKIPLFGKLSLFYNLTNICRTMSLLLRNDVRIVPAIELVAASTRNLVYREELLASKERIVKGQKISMQFKQNKRLFPPMLVQMVAIAESTGNLGGTFAYLSEMYEEEIGDLTKNLTTMIEPILMIIMGLIVGFIAISIITPIYSITQSITPH
ncbi:MAG: Type II secretion system F domain-containing protein [Candidatus Kaiserbacteria bacterium GW2011_GWC2_52_8b]|uniref:Type II secretion system F domain-containing protein n=2 Tax=Candidatus Kaiseribacteriota TaxID=1752734 RepID=A0A0G1XKV1_9BACT|nr:MAG: Type II secretion system F domain-containing protein [Candidatus Kaiserbacteria bacterium GW2011_GWA2_52_12]KKW31888.1 MAG: Type II secretion system F domain-containing protein [Candidatus Kaiserbacteria bacterium GW2011_GWC2_52_8b]